MSTKFGSGRTRRVYEFIRSHREHYDVRQMCRVLEVTHSGYYAWLKKPQSRRAIENARPLKLIRASLTAVTPKVLALLITNSCARAGVTEGKPGTSVVPGRSGSAFATFELSKW